jgi:hypothetical protein
MNLRKVISERQGNNFPRDFIPNGFNRNPIESTPQKRAES